MRHDSREEWIAFAAVTVTVLAVAAPAVAALKPRIAELVPNTGLSPTCDQQEAKWIRLAQCQRGISPTVAVWGDSYAEQLVGGVPANVSVVQITKSACAPIPGIAQVTDVYGETFARRCAAFNQNVLQNLMSDPSIRQVVISSPFAQVLANEGQKLIVDGKVQPWSELLAAQRLTAALIALRIAGKEPIIVAPTPRAEFDPGQCNVRKVVGLPVLGRSDCALPRSAFTPDYVSTLDQLRRIAISTGVALYIPEDVLCGRTVCFTRIGNMIVFRDGEGHLTRSASKYLLSTFGLAEKLNTIRPANF